MTVELRALDGRDPLGFLAALGVLRLLGSEAKLSFEPAAGTARLHGPWANVDAAVADLVALVDRSDPDAPIPGVSPSFPLAKATRKGGTAQAEENGKVDQSDPMRVARASFATVVKKVRDLDSGAADVWLPSLVTDLAVDRAGRVALSPFMAPSGQQSVRTFFVKAAALVRADPAGHIKGALTRWRRVDGFTGEYLDHRVLRSGADHPSGESVEAGVPGATWLATMALPLFRLSGDGSRPSATSWDRIGGRLVMYWPLWTAPLDASAIKVLLGHPAVAPKASQEGGKRLDVEMDAPGASLREMSVFTVCAAERRQIEGRKSAGVLTPVPVELR